MSHSYLDFADYDAAYRYSNTPSIATAELQPLSAPGKPALIHIRAPPSRSLSLSLSKPSSGAIASRRRAQSETTASPDLTAEAGEGAGAERPISAILVNFVPIDWTSTAHTESEPHPGKSASVRSVEALEAVSPKSKLPGVLQRVLQRTPALNQPSNSKSGKRIIVVEPLKIGKENGRKGTSVVALKSPYPWPQREEWLDRVKMTIERGVNHVSDFASKAGGKLRSKM